MVEIRKKSEQGPILKRMVEDILSNPMGLATAMAQIEAAVIAEALEQQQGNRSAAARQLKMPRQTLQDRMKKHGLWAGANPPLGLTATSRNGIPGE